MNTDDFCLRGHLSCILKEKPGDKCDRRVPGRRTGNTEHSGSLNIETELFDF